MSAYTEARDRLRGAHVVEPLREDITAVLTVADRALAALRAVVEAVEPYDTHDKDDVNAALIAAYAVLTVVE